MSDINKEIAAEVIVDTSDSVYLFATYFLKTLLIADSADFQIEIYKMLPSSSRIVLAAPRGFAKSTISTVIYPLWLSLWKKSNDICIISASENLAVDFMRKIKSELVSNPFIKEYFGEQQSDKWSENHIILKNGVNIRAKGSGAQIKGFRPDMIILDDIETPEEVKSEELRRNLKSWLFKDCMPSLTPDGKMLIIGTIDHPLSVLAELLATDNGWTKHKYMAYKDGVQQEGHELWPEVWPHMRLQQMKATIGSFYFSSQYMNSPIDDESSPIKESQIRRWKELPKQYNAVIAVDPAYSEDATADYKTASLVLCDSYGNRFLSHYIRTHVPIGEFQDAIINLWLSNRSSITAIGVPNSGTEKAFFDSFLRKCSDRRLYPPVVELKNSFVQSGTSISIRNKTSRIIAALQPLFENGKYYIGENMPEAIDELLSIGVSKNDDIVDTLAYAETLIQPYYGQTMVDENGNNVNLEMEASRSGSYGYDDNYRDDKFYTGIY